MFLQPARSSQPYVLFFFTILAGILWFVLPQNDNICSFPVFPLFQWVKNINLAHSIVAKFISLTSFLIIFSLNLSLNTKFQFTGQRSYLSGIIFLFLVFFIYQTNLFHPVLWAGIFLLLAMERVLGTYRQENLSYRIFDAAFVLGIASNIYFPVFFLIPTLFFSIIILRPFFWREWALSIIGFLLPFYFNFAFSFLLNMPESKSFIDFFFDSIRFSCPHPEFNHARTITFYYILFLIFWASLHLLRTLGGLKIIQRQSFYIFFLLTLNIVAIYGLVPQAGNEIFILAAIPVSYLMSFSFQSFRKKNIYIILFDIFILLVIIHRLVRW